MSYQLDFIFLLKAIKEKALIDIYYWQDQQTWEYYSRFISLTPEGNSITIELPVSKKDTYKSLESGYSILVVFKLAGFRFQFKTTVIKKMEVLLPPDKKAPAISVAWPEEIHDGNRRNLFRLQVMMYDKIQVSYKLHGENKPRQQAIKAFDFDICQNGMGIIMEKGSDIQVGDNLSLNFQLTKNTQDNISIQGIVRNKRQSDELSDVYGIEFIQKDTASYIKALKQISVYILSKKEENISFADLNNTVSKNELVVYLAQGYLTEELVKMILAKGFPFGDIDYLESLAYISKIPKFFDQAIFLFSQIPHAIKAGYVQRTDANHWVAYTILKESLKNQNFQIIATILENSFLPIEFLLKIAKEGSIPILDLMLKKKSLLDQYPEIVDVMMTNPEVIPPLRAKIKNMQKTINPLVKKTDKEKDDMMSRITLEIAKGKAKDSKKSNIQILKEAEIETISIIQKIYQMPTTEKVLLALEGSKPERMVLSRDRDKQVQLSLISNPAITSEEIEFLLHNKDLDSEIVLQISENPNWCKHTSIISQLIVHPNLPGEKMEVLAKQLKDHLNKDKL